jgi:hypothetical protein
LIGTKALDGYVCSTKKKKEKLATNATTAGRYPNEVNPVLYFERANERGKTLFCSSSSSSVHDLIRKKSGGGGGKETKNKKTKTVGCLGPGNATATLTMERNEIDLVSLLRGSDVAAVVEANCACVGVVSAREDGRASLSLSLSLFAIPSWRKGRQGSDVPILLCHLLRHLSHVP